MEQVMKVGILVIVCLAALLVAGILLSSAQAQPPPQEPDFAKQIDTIFIRAGTLQNRQKFFSILIYILIGGACTYEVMRGTKKVFSKG